MEASGPREEGREPIPEPGDPPPPGYGQPPPDHGGDQTPSSGYGQPPPGHDGDQTSPPGYGQAPPPGQSPAVAAPLSPQDVSNLAMLAHLSALVSLIGLPSFVGPMIVWLVNREKHPFVDAEGKEALNFNLSVLIYAAAAGLLAFVATIVTFGIALFLFVPVFIGAGIAWFVFVILAAIRASKGQPYRYPLTIRMIR
jgi:uncharacterized Tic20 family protein